jgi:signal peptidase
MINSLKFGLMGCIGLIIFINLYLGINKAITHNPIPKFMGITPLIVLSGSMKPAVMPGDVVLIREQEPYEYKLGDVATYLVGTTAFTHRIIGEENGAFVLKGDNNNAADDIVKADQFSGKVICRIPKIGLAIIFLKTPPGIVLLLVMLLLVIYGEEIFYRISNHQHK